MDQPVEHGIGDGGIADVRMPVVDRQLAGDDGGGAAMAVVDDLQQVASLLCGERGQTTIIEDQDLYAGEALEHAGIAPIAACQAEAFQHARDPLIEH
jgi:hypothetical protein